MKTGDEQGPAGSAPRSDWSRLAAKVVQRRHELGLSQPDVYKAGGPSAATQRKIEGAMQDGYRASIFGQLENALRWRSGTCELVLAGGEPIPLEPDSRTAPSPMDDEQQRHSHQFGPQPPQIVISLPESARTATDAEREEIEAAAKAEALRVWREINRGKP